MKEPLIIGRAERIDLVDVGVSAVPAKIDTGADVSAIWTHSIQVTDDGLDCVFFGPGSQFYTGETFHFARQTYTMTRIANSFGTRETRYKVKLRIRVKGRLIVGTFTLSNRATKLYPILIGRRLLKNKFLVDVSGGQALHNEELARAKALEQHLKSSQKGSL